MTRRYAPPWTLLFFVRPALPCMWHVMTCFLVLRFVTAQCSDWAALLSETETLMGADMTGIVSPDFRDMLASAKTDHS